MRDLTGIIGWPSPVMGLVKSALLFLVLGFILGYVKGCSDERRELILYKEKVESAARVAEQQARDRIERERLAKESADRLAARLRRDLSATRERLRDYTSSSILPTASSTSTSSERVTFDRAELELSLRAFIEGVSELIGEGDEAVVGLSVAREWAYGISQ